MASEHPTDRQSKSPGRPQLVLLAVVLAAVLLSLGLVYWIESGARPPGESMAGLAVGQPAPAIAAAGWLRSEPPADLRGKVVVVDAWASWCVPCRMQVPKLIASYNKYYDRGVVFVGLTSQEEDELPAIESFLDEMSIPWSNGYGASETLQGFEAVAIPTVWVIGPDGRVVWNIDSDGTVDDGIEAALAMVEKR